MNTKILEPDRDLHPHKKPTKSARELVFIILNKIESRKAYANLLLDKELEESSLSSKDKNLVTEIVYGIIRQKRYIDWVLEQFLDKKKEKLPVRLRNIFRIGIYQILFLDKIPEYAAVNETISLAIKEGFQNRKNFINGLLRNIQRNKESISLDGLDMIRTIGIQFSHPDWIVEIYLDKFGKEHTLQLCEFNNTPATLTLRPNLLKIQRDELMELFIKENIQSHASTLVPDSIIIDTHIPVSHLPGYSNGFFHIQDEASQLVCHIVQPKPGDHVLDLCAAPGGKSFLMAQLMKNQGKLIAMDIHPHRVRLLKEMCNKLGTTIVKTMIKDATKDLSDILGKSLDVILLDAPCSGLGVLRRKVDSRWNKKKEHIPGLTKLQHDILENALHYLKPGGVLVYSTCTLAQEENEDQIQAFLSRHPDIYLESIKNYLPESAKHTLTQTGCMLTLPHRDGTDGMFACRLRKKNI